MTCEYLLGTVPATRALITGRGNVWRLCDKHAATWQLRFGGELSDDVSRRYQMGPVRDGRVVEQ